MQWHLGPLIGLGRRFRHCRELCHTGSNLLNDKQAVSPHVAVTSPKNALWITQSPPGEEEAYQCRIDSELGLLSTQSGHGLLNGLGLFSVGSRDVQYRALARS